MDFLPKGRKSEGADCSFNPESVQQPGAANGEATAWGGRGVWSLLDSGSHSGISQECVPALYSSLGLQLSQAIQADPAEAIGAGRYTAAWQSVPGRGTRTAHREGQ